MRNSLGILAVIIIAAACTPRGTQMPPVLPTSALEPSARPTATRLPAETTPAQRAAIATLARGLNIPEAQIRVVSTEAVTWPNGCLGIQRIGMMCTENLVPGFKIMLAAAGKQYELHTNADGSVVAPEAPMLAASPAVEAAISQLAANLGLPKSDVTLVNSTAIEWPDSCLGVAQAGVMCAQVVTPGYLILLDAQGREYEYHTTQDASRIVPGSLALKWSQIGGIAGFCRELNVYLSGEVYGLDCKGGADGHMEVLTSAQREQLHSWIDRFGTSAIDLSDPKGAADGMSRQATLFGSGPRQPEESEQRAIYDFGQMLFQDLYR